MRTAVNKCLTNSSKITKNKKEIKSLIAELANTKGLDDYDLKEKFINKKIARDTYRCQHKTFIDKAMRCELKLMKHILSNPNMYNLQTPIAHIIQREPDFITYGDACLEAGGGYCENLFWWHVEWPENIKALTLKNLLVTKKFKLTNELVSINLLEFVIKIINYAAISVLFAQQPSLCQHEFPLLLN